MIEKMCFINIIGCINDVDRIIEKYISKFDIYPEIETELFEKTQSLNQKAQRILADKVNQDNKPMQIKLNAEPSSEQTDLNLQTKLDTIRNLINNLRHFKDFESDFDYYQLSKFQFVHYKFGFMPLNNYHQYKTFLYDEKDILLLDGEVEEDKIWCAYFTYNSHAKHIDKLFSSFNFEPIDTPFEIDDLKLTGTIEQILSMLEKKFAELEMLLEQKNFTPDQIIKRADSKIYDAKKFCVALSNDFFVFQGWIKKVFLAPLNNEIKNDNSVILISDDSARKNPPVFLKNNFFFKPFELFVKMYGIPNYNEIDPTPFLAITYTILFGLMFGDLGQGLILFLSGIFLSIKKNNPLFRIISTLGVSSMIFGILYGSVFGFEELLPALWLKPSNSINFILIFTVISGVFLLLMSMIFNLINCKKNRDYKNLFFNSNGILGISFYICTLSSCLAIATKKNLSMIMFLFSIAFISLILIGFSEPIKKLLSGQRKIFGSNIFLFIFQTIIELFETILSYFTNTISFIRVGAFALSHAGMMSVVMLLAKSDAGTYNWFIILLGNIIVIALEGLIVGIQVLRLEFYEMFGRFFKGNGRSYFPERKNF